MRLLEKRFPSHCEEREGEAISLSVMNFEIASPAFSELAMTK